MTTESMRENARAVMRELRGEPLPTGGDFLNSLARVVNADKAKREATERGVLVPLDARRKR